jgi:hypothetical protein
MTRGIKTGIAGQQIDDGYLPAAHTDADRYIHFPKMNLLVAGGVVSAALSHSR